MLRYILFTLIFTSLFLHEGFTIYNENLNTDQQYPDNTQYYSGINNKYNVVTNSIKEPQHGVYSGFLDSNYLRGFDHFFHSPITDKNIGKDVSYSRQLDYQIIQQEDPNKYELLENEKLNDRLIHNPFFTHGSPDNNSPILYNDEIQQMMLKHKRKTNRYENVSHTGPGHHPVNTE